MPTWLGIDIGKSAVKVAAVRTSYRKVSLFGLGCVELSSTMGSTDEAIRQAVAQALGKPGVGDGMAASLDGVKATLRVLSIPASAQRQLAEVLPFELEAQVPFELSDSVLDYRVLAGLRNLPEADASTLPVLAGVARVADVQERIDLVKGALGAEPERIGVGALPIANLMATSPALSDPGPVVLVDLGTESSDVVVFRSGEPVFVRTLSQGTAGLPETAPRLAREIRLTISAFRASGGPTPLRIYLAGGGAFVSGAEAFLANELEMPVALLPAPGIEYEVAPADRLRELPRFMKALGLAMGLAGRPVALDLRKGPLTYERGFGWIREKIPVMAGLGAVLAVSFFFSACTQFYALGKETEVVEKALSTVSKDVLGEETSSAERANELLAQQAGPDDDPMAHADAFDVMVKLSDAIPQSMKHDIEDLDLNKGHVVVHGVVGSIPDAQSIATSLRSDPCFADVKITRTDQVVGGERKKYTLEFDLKCPEDQKGKKSATTPAGSASAASSASSGGK